MQDEAYYVREYVRYREYYNVMLQWVLLCQKGIKIGKYLSLNGYKKIVIYGMSDIGNCLVGELKTSIDCRVLYTIDQGSPKLYHDIKCFRIEDIRERGLEEPDIIIVTLPQLYEQIKYDISQAIHCVTLSITELIYNAYYDFKLKDFFNESDKIRTIDKK